MPREQLTDIAVRAMKPPQSGQIMHWDKSLAGFGLRVSQGGAKTFVLVHGVNRHRTTIGRFPVVSLGEARAEAKRLLAERTLGKHQPKSVTFEAALVQFLARATAPRTLRDYTRILNRYFLPAFRRMQVAEITPNQVLHRLDAIKAPAEKFHAYAILRAFFRWALKRNYLLGSPCERVEAPPRGVSRERVLSTTELAEVIAKAPQEGYPFGYIVLLLILTGQRRGEIAALEWEWINKEERTITLPAWITKNRREHTFPYGQAVADILDALPRFDSPYLFPAQRDKVKGQPATVFNGWGKPKERLDASLEDVEHWTLHDLRRTFSSGWAALKVPPHVTEKMLNHVTGTVSGVAAIYNRYQYLDEMREAVAAWEDKLRSLVRPD